MLGGELGFTCSTCIEAVGYSLKYPMRVLAILRWIHGKADITMVPKVARE